MGVSVGSGGGPARISGYRARWRYPLLNLIFGIVFIVGGLSGQMALIGTNSPGALVVVGFGVAGLGAYQLSRKGTED